MNNSDAIVAVWPVLLEAERAALGVEPFRRQLRNVKVRVRPDGKPRRIALSSNRLWNTNEQARLGNVWDRVMNGTGAEGMLNAQMEQK